MRKFSDINNTNEEFLNVFKKNISNDINEFTLVRKDLLILYCNNLINNEYLKLKPQELEKFDFKFYKAKSVEKLSDYRYRVVLTTYDDDKKEKRELIYYLEIEKY